MTRAQPVTFAAFQARLQRWLGPVLIPACSVCIVRWAGRGVRAFNFVDSMRQQNRSRLLYPATAVAGGRIGHRRLVPQRRRSIWSIFFGRSYNLDAPSRAWSRQRQSPPSALNPARPRPAGPIQIGTEIDDNRYYQESIDLNEDSILSDELLEALSRPLSGGPARPQHAFAVNRLTSRPAGYNRPKQARVRRIKVD